MDERGSLQSRLTTLGYLKALYTIVAGLSLQTAVAAIIDVRQSGTPLRWGVLPLFIAYLVTLVPFFHGALWHLDEMWSSEEGRAIRRGVMMLDFSLLFVEAGLLFALAELTNDPRYFGWALLLLLLLDIGWATAISRLTEQPLSAEMSWMTVNLAAVVPLVVVVLLLPGPWLQALLVVIAVARTTADYSRSWTHYFP